MTGTLTATTGASQYTITNFSETRDGVSNDGNTTIDANPTNPTNPNGLPQFEVLTNTYPMTAAQKAQFCPVGHPAGLGSAANRPAPTRLVPGRGVAKVQLGEGQRQVLRALGPPRTRLFWPRPCRGLQRGCDAVPAAGGTWMYRGLSIRFALNGSVAGLIYRGNRRTVRGHPLAVARVGTADRPLLHRREYLEDLGPGHRFLLRVAERQLHLVTHLLLMSEFVMRNRRRLKCE